MGAVTSKTAKDNHLNAFLPGAQWPLGQDNSPFLHPEGQVLFSNLNSLPDALVSDNRDK